MTKNTILVFSIILAVGVCAPTLSLSQQTEEPSTETETSAGRQKEATSAKSKSDKPALAKEFDLTFDDLKFEMEKTEKFKRSMITPKIQAYHHATVRLRGYIKPAVKSTGLTHFIFVRDNKECCFGPTAALFDNVLVRLKKGVTTDYTTRPVTIEGHFYLKEYVGDNGRVWSIYKMKDGRVK